MFLVEALKKFAKKQDSDRMFEVCLGFFWAFLNLYFLSVSLIPLTYFLHENISVNEIQI